VEGQKTIDALGLVNIQLREMSILDVDDSFGLFDYVICHGVYSWVSADVQEKILDICKHHLLGEGIGYMSYNTYPGWHMRGMIRAMMALHDKRFRERPPSFRVGQARALLSFLANSVPQETVYGQFLREELELLKKVPDGYLFHDHLEHCNAPIYFTEFCERLAAHGLRYLGEAEFRAMVPSASFSPAVEEQLNQLAPTLLETEQYMDLLRNRMFRQTLLCHEDIQPNYQVHWEQLTQYHIASPVKPKSGTPNCSSETPESFTGKDNVVMTSSAPLVKAALIGLGEIWPRAMSFDELLDNARARLGAAENPNDAQTLAEALLNTYARAGEHLIELWLRPPVFRAQVSECPVASPLARFQAGTSPYVTNLRHEIVALNPFNRDLLPFLDGTRNHQALLETMMERFERRAFQISRQNESITDATKARQVLELLLKQQLPELARSALLVA
jgi:methyltransferase-like protein